MQGFQWEEFDDSGQSSLSEAGARYCIGVSSRLFLSSQRDLFIEMNLEFLFGRVGYDGYLITQLGQRVPYSTATSYTGYEGLFHMGFSFTPLTALQFAPVVGFGIEYWNRDLDDGGTRGYDESYSVSLASLGITAKYLIAQNAEVFSAVFLRIPISLSEAVDIASRGQGGPENLTLEPGINSRLLVEAGGMFSRVYAALYFETWTLSKSNVEQGYFQPESTRNHFGVKLGYSFSLP